MDGRGAFLVVANGRTGTTWLITSLGALPDVATDFEVKLPPFNGNRVHRILGRDGPTCRSILESVSGTAPVVGSKLVFEAEMPERSVLTSLVRYIERDIRIVHLKRGYWGQLLSARGREFIHILNEESNFELESGNAYFESMKRSAAKFGDDLSRAVKREVPKPQYLVAYVIFSVLWDLAAVHLARACDRALFLDYCEIGSRFAEVASFVGSRCGEEEAARVIANPLTKKLPNLADGILPQSDFLKMLCGALDEKVSRVIRDGIPIEEVWKPDGTVDFGTIQIDSNNQSVRGTL